MSVTGVQPGGRGLSAHTVFPEFSLTGVTHYRVELTNSLDAPEPGAQVVEAQDRQPQGVEVSTASRNGIGALTVFPELDRSTIAAYNVRLVGGPEGAAEPEPESVPSAAGGEFPGGVRFVDVVPGAWTVEIEAFGAEGEVLLHGEAEVWVTAGSITPATVSLRYLGSGEGAYEVTVEWSVSSAVEQVEYRTVVETGEEPDDGSNGVWQTA